MEPGYGQNKTIEIIRWIALFPIAFTGGIIIYNIIIALNMIAVELNAYPGSFFTILLGRCIGDYFLGTAAVVIAWIIAPFYKRQLTLLMACILTTISCISLLVSLLSADYKGMFSAFSISIGSVSAAYIIIKKEAKKFKN